MFVQGGKQLGLHVDLSTRNGVHTGGHVWNASRHLSRWLFARHELLRGQRVLELACGIAVPSLVCAMCGAAEVLATDELPRLAEHLEVNKRANALSGSNLRGRVLDFTCRDDVVAAAGAWDIIMFADCVYGGSCGSELPHALATLLLSRAGAVAVGTFPDAIREGVDAFFAECASAGLQVSEQTSAADEHGGRLFLFTTSERTIPRSDWGRVDDALATLSPLF